MKLVKNSHPYDWPFAITCGFLIASVLSPLVPMLVPAVAHLVR
jgi:hypothetical protein